MKLRTFSKQPLSHMVVHGIENAEKNKRSVSSWIDRISELHQSKPPPTISYSKPMPGVYTQGFRRSNDEPLGNSQAGHRSSLWEHCILLPRGRSNCGFGRFLLELRCRLILVLAAGHFLIPVSEGHKYDLDIKRHVTVPEGTAEQESFLVSLDVMHQIHCLVGHPGQPGVSNSDSQCNT